MPCPDLISIHSICVISILRRWNTHSRCYIFAEEPSGACPEFLKGRGPVSLGSLNKRSSDFKRGGPMV